MTLQRLDAPKELNQGRLNAEIVALQTGKMDVSRALTLTENATPGEGLEIIEGPAAFYPEIRPKSNAGTLDVDLRLNGLGTGRVYVDGDLVLHEGEFQAKGDILVATGAGAFVALTVGSDGDVLTADSVEASGVKWAAGGGGGGLSQSQVLARQSFGGF